MPERITPAEYRQPSIVGDFENDFDQRLSLGTVCRGQAAAWRIVFNSATTVQAVSRARAAGYDVAAEGPAHFCATALGTEPMDEMRIPSMSKRTPLQRIAE